MAQCPHCHMLIENPASTHCQACGRELAAQGPAPGGAPFQPHAPGYQQQGHAGSAFQEQALATARDVWARVQSSGPTKVGLGLIAGSAVFWVWSNQAGVWRSSGIFELLLMVAVVAYLGVREFKGQDPLARFWWAVPAATLYLVIWSLTELSLRLGTGIYLAGVGLLAWSILPPWFQWLRQIGFDWRYALYGYRRVLALGALVVFLSLFLTWIPETRTAGWWSSGYYYSWYNPGLYFPSFQGTDLTGATLMLGFVASFLFYAMFAGQIALPQWYRYLPLIGAGYGLVFMVMSGSLSWGQLLCVIGLAAVGWAGYQLGIKGQAEGQLDLREIPLDRWLQRFM